MQFAAFRFLPIEPPRPEATKQETYARRQHEFAPGPPAVSRRGLFDSGKKSAPPPRSSEQARFRVDARLPNPAIITCNEPLPLRVLVQKQSASSESAILQMIQIELIGYTHVRAHDLTRVEVGSWVIMSYSNMSIPLGDGNTPEGTEIKIDEKLWKNIPIPNTVAPSFYTCNIRRSYELEVRVGLGYGSVGKIRVRLHFHTFAEHALISYQAGTHRAPAPTASRGVLGHRAATGTARSTREGATARGRFAHGRAPLHRRPVWSIQPVPRPSGTSHEHEPRRPPAAAQLRRCHRRGHCTSGWPTARLRRHAGGIGWRWARVVVVDWKYPECDERRASRGRKRREGWRECGLETGFISGLILTRTFRALRFIACYVTLPYLVIRTDSVAIID